MPVYGYFVIGGFGTFAAYLPELFPTRVRATGQGFCWNFARSITALGPLIAGSLIGVMGSIPSAAAVTCWLFVSRPHRDLVRPGDARRASGRLTNSKERA